MTEKFNVGQEVKWGGKHKKFLTDYNNFELGAGPFKVWSVINVPPRSEKDIGHSQLIQVSREVSVPGVGLVEMIWDRFNHQWTQPENISYGERIIPTKFSGAYFEPIQKTTEK
jgi:hypothetical protein